MAVAKPAHTAFILYNMNCAWIRPLHSTTIPTIEYVNGPRIISFSYNYVKFNSVFYLVFHVAKKGGGGGGESKSSRAI